MHFLPSPPPLLILRNRLHKLPVIHLVPPGIHRALEQLLHLLLTHLLAQIRQNVLDLALSDEPRAVLVEHLEPPDVLFDVEGLAEAAGAVEDLGEGVEVDYRWLADVFRRCVREDGVDGG